jgi:hypothetical protein
MIMRNCIRVLGANIPLQHLSNMEKTWVPKLHPEMHRMKKHSVPKLLNQMIPGMAFRYRNGTHTKQIMMRPGIFIGEIMTANRAKAFQKQYMMMRICR